MSVCAARLALGTGVDIETIDLGGIEYARLLEPLAMLWIHLARVNGLGREFAFGLAPQIIRRAN